MGKQLIQNNYKKNEKYYEINKKLPYTGEVIDYYKSGEIWIKESYHEGKQLNQEMFDYYETGEIKFYRNY